MLYLIGLGNCEEDITLRAARILETADVVAVKSRQISSCSYFSDREILDFDDMFVRARSFDRLYGNIAKKVCALDAGGKTAAYCVEGSGAHDRTVKEILRRRKDAVLVAGVEKCADISARAQALSLVRVTAAELCAAKAFDNSGLPVVVMDVDDGAAAAEVKLKLADLFGDRAEILFGRAGAYRAMPLYELDRQTDYGYDTCVLACPASLAERERYTLTALWEILAVLRGENGCPWDRAQTHESLKANTVEEAYEVLEAIDLADDAKLCEELGDYLLQPLFHAQLSEEEGAFSLGDVVTELARKLVFRHSHIFGGDRAANEAEALDTWEKNKRTEKGQDTVSRSVEDIPATFPAVLYAQKFHKRASKLPYFNEVAAKKTSGAGAALYAYLADMRAAGTDAETALYGTLNLLRDKLRKIEAALPESYDERDMENAWDRV